MSELGIPDLVEALRELRGRFAADAVSAAYVSPDGVMVTVQVTAGELVTLEDDDGNVSVIEVPE